MHKSLSVNTFRPSPMLFIYIERKKEKRGGGKNSGKDKKKICAYISTSNRTKDEGLSFALAVNDKCNRPTPCVQFIWTRARQDEAGREGE